MKHLKSLGIGVAMALVLAACFGATSASATTICVMGTMRAPCTDGQPGGAVSLFSRDSSVTVTGGGSFNCRSSVIAGTAPSGSATTLSIPVSLAYTGCTIMGVSPIEVTTVGCAGKITLNAMYNQAAMPQGSSTLTLHSGCNIIFHIPTVLCTWTIRGQQTIGLNGGITWTNGTSTSFSSATVSAALVPTIDVDNTAGLFGCPTPGTHTGTLAGTYPVTSPATAPGVTLIP